MSFNSLKPYLKQFPFIYPARIILSCKDWIDRSNTKSGGYLGLRKNTYQLIEPAENHTHQLPELRQKEDAPKFSANIFYQTSVAGLFYLKDCCLYKQMGLVITNRNGLFQEFTHHFNIESLRKFLLTRPFYIFSKRVRNINGIGAVLVSPQSNNYYHWLSDVLPRIKLYSSVLNHIDHFCVSASVPQKFIDILPKFGIHPDKMLLINDDERYHFDNLYVASLPGSEGRTPRWAATYLREVVLKGSDKAPANRMMYLKRGENTVRKIINEGQIISILRSKGFEIIDPGNLSIEEQISLVQQARVIVSAHGAALSNLLFAKEGTSVLEIFSPDYFRTDCYFTLANILSLNYHYLLGNKPANVAWGDIAVDETEFFAIIEKLNY